MENTRTLSSDWTPCIKVFSTISAIVAGLILLAVATPGEEGASQLILLLLPLCIGINLAVILPLKEVELKDGVLKFRSFSRQAQAPLASVGKIRGSRMFRPERIILFLDRPTEFGTKITFAPPGRLFGPWFGPHPLLKELRHLVEQAKLEPYPARGDMDCQAGFPGG